LSPPPGVQAGRDVVMEKRISENCAFDAVVQRQGSSDGLGGWGRSEAEPPAASRRPMSRILQQRRGHRTAERRLCEVAAIQAAEIRTFRAILRFGRFSVADAMEIQLRRPHGLSSGMRRRRRRTESCFSGAAIRGFRVLMSGTEHGFILSGDASGRIL